nr:hypothetical protein CFP56_07633 [Quercus suber]
MSQSEGTAIPSREESKSSLIPVDRLSAFCTPCTLAQMNMEMKTRATGNLATSQAKDQYASQQGGMVYQAPNAPAPYSDEKAAQASPVYDPSGQVPVQVQQTGQVAAAGLLSTLSHCALVVNLMSLELVINMLYTQSTAHHCDRLTSRFHNCGSGIILKCSELPDVDRFLILREVPCGLGPVASTNTGADWNEASDSKFKALSPARGTELSLLVVPTIAMLVSGGARTWLKLVPRLLTANLLPACSSPPSTYQIALEGGIFDAPRFSIEDLQVPSILPRHRGGSSEL